MFLELDALKITLSEPISHAIYVYSRDCHGNDFYEIQWYGISHILWYRIGVVKLCCQYGT